MRIGKVKHTCENMASFIVTLLAVMMIGIAIAYSSSHGDIKKKRNWKQQCQKEYIVINRIFAHDGKNHRAILRISNCVDLLTDYCLGYLKDVCPRATNGYPDIIKRAYEANRTRDVLIKLGK